MEIALGLLLLAAIALLIWYSRKPAHKRQCAEAEFPDDIPEIVSSSRSKGKHGTSDDRHESEAGDGSGGDGGGD